MTAQQALCRPWAQVERQLILQEIPYRLTITGAPNREPFGNDWRVVRAVEEAGMLCLTVCAFRTDVMAQA